MNNFEKVAYDNASGDLRLLYDEILSKLKTDTLPNWVVFLGSNTQVLKGLWVMFESTMLQGSLSPLLKELILFNVSLNNIAPYCTEYHASNILKASQVLDYEELLKLIGGESQGELPESYYTAISVMTTHSESRCVLPSMEKDKLVNAGFSDMEIVELTGVCALAVALNTFTLAGEIPIDSNHKVDSFFMP